MALDPVAFQQTSVHEVRAPVAQVLEDLRALGVVARWEQRKRWWLVAGACALVLLGGTAVFLSALLMTREQTREYSTPVHAAFWVGVVLAVALLVIRRDLGEIKLDLRRHNLVSTLLKRFQVDLDAKAPVHLMSLRVRLAQDWVARAPTASRPGKQTPDTGRPDASRTATMMLLSLYQVLGSIRRADGRRTGRRARPV
ncbi:MAG: hypothetical protein EOO71_04200 [Myxococcaceae bacterium]|nr:MAG: hypothetical protein EOO71_04200 [Myxococcaceae bacterium]